MLAFEVVGVNNKIGEWNDKDLFLVWIEGVFLYRPSASHFEGEDWTMFLCKSLSDCFIFRSWGERSKNNNLILFYFLFF